MVRFNINSLDLFFNVHMFEKSECHPGKFFNSSLNKNKTYHLPCDPAPVLLSSYPKEMQTSVYTKTLTRMFTVAVFVIAKYQKQPRCLNGQMVKQSGTPIPRNILLNNKKKQTVHTGNSCGCWGMGVTSWGSTRDDGIVLYLIMMVVALIYM